MTQTVKVIKNLMDKHGVSQKYMAEQIGVSPAAVCKWMQGTRNPDIQHVEKMAKVLGYKLSIVIMEAQRMNRVEENKELVELFVKSAMEKSGTYEEIVAWHLGSINSFLADISKSLAVIADSMSRPKEDK